ncbi:MAG: DUF4340 domain-containing protein [Treponema sp.]|nr:DUF4340 domain-containing protein [Treponema sp.]
MNRTFSKRRIVLTAALAVLAIIYIVQVWSSSRTGIKIVKTEGEPSEITITKGMDSENEIHLVKDSSGNWTLGSKKYPADENTVSAIINSLKEIKILGTAASLSGDGSRYGLDDASKIIVTASDSSKTLITLVVGKNTSTGNQSYVQLDGKNTVLLANKALHSLFDTNENAIRSRRVYSLSPAEISSVKVSGKNGSFTVKKENASQNAAGDENAPLPTTWLLEKTESYADEKISSEKVSAWVSTISSVNVAAWADEVYPGKKEDEPIAEITLLAGGKEYSLSIVYEEEISETESKYLCESNQTPYRFYISAYTAGNVKKTLKDLAD